VVFVNDDYTPMDWVVELLEKYFDYSMENAINIMLQVHTTGKSVVGIYPKDIAETKSYIVNLISQEKGHPFKSVIEED
jgi:ATP-dependent Clp protease adaptor protein ClpS